MKIASGKNCKIFLGGIEIGSLGSWSLSTVPQIKTDKVCQCPQCKGPMILFSTWKVPFDETTTTFHKYHCYHCNMYLPACWDNVEMIRWGGGKGW
jgi:hypothetical protein